MLCVKMVSEAEDASPRPAFGHSDWLSVALLAMGYPAEESEAMAEALLWTGRFEMISGRMLKLMDMSERLGAI